MSLYLYPVRRVITGSQVVFLLFFPSFLSIFLSFFFSPLFTRSLSVNSRELLRARSERNTSKYSEEEMYVSRWTEPTILVPAISKVPRYIRRGMVYECLLVNNFSSRVPVCVKIILDRRNVRSTLETEPKEYVRTYLRECL